MRAATDRTVLVTTYELMQVEGALLGWPICGGDWPNSSNQTFTHVQSCGRRMPPGWGPVCPVNKCGLVSDSLWLERMVIEGLIRK